MENNSIKKDDYLNSFLVFWQEKMPKYVDVIMEVLAPFYDPGLSFDLKAPTEDLEEFCQKAIFWQDIKGVRVINQDNFEAKARLWWRKTGINYLGTNLKDNFDDNIVDGNFYANLEDSFLDNIGDDFSEELDGLLQVDFWTSLFYACAFVIVGDKEKDFQPLLKLWRSGNLPVGFDSFGYLIVLCADSTD